MNIIPLPSKPPRGYQYGVMRLTQVVNPNVKVEPERFTELAPALAHAETIDWRLWPTVIPVKD